MHFLVLFTLSVLCLYCLIVVCFIFAHFEIILVTLLLCVLCCQDEHLFLHTYQPCYSQEKKLLYHFNTAIIMHPLPQINV